uniref:Defective in cullin neddylation protein n=1 Tax=Rhizophora mucronata TaxID=61149 RepID=A0A2P2JQ40_RHIMU
MMKPNGANFCGMPWLSY